jgi:6-phosphogluconolactonase
MIRPLALTSIAIITAIQQGLTMTVYIGTTPGGNSGALGIYHTTLEEDTGVLSAPAELAVKVKSAGFLAWHPAKPVLYSLNGADLASFSIPVEADGKVLAPLNTVSSGAGKGTHLDVHPDGSLLVSVHYGSGHITAFPLKEDGQIGPASQVIQLEAFSTTNPGRQGKPHPHSANFDPSGRFVLVPDLGADTTYIYACDTGNATLSFHGKGDSAPGAGPRHMKFSPDGRFACVLNELDLTVDVFAWDGDDGILKRTQTIATLSDEQKALKETNTASEIRFHPNGKFIYTANRGHNSISIFTFDPTSGHMERVGVVDAHVNWPRNFNLDPSGKWLLCGGQWSNDVTVFSVDPGSGTLIHHPEGILAVPGPICVEFGR